MAALSIEERIVPVPLPGLPDAFGLLTQPQGQAARWGVLIVVGGPQTRVGAHRHFVQLARDLAGAGFAALRFDHRGLGDSPAALQPFDQLDDDLQAGLDALHAACPGLQGVCLWGLCDAAAAALLYVARRPDARVRALALLNPWVRSAQGQAQTQLKHYYWERLRSPTFWRKLLRGGVGLGALGGWWRARQAARSAAAPPSPRSFQRVMAEGWRRFPGPVLLQLSGRDHTAREFEAVAEVFPDWAGWAQRPGLTRQDYAQADHTFSRCSVQQDGSAAFIAWLHAQAQATA